MSGDIGVARVPADAADAGLRRGAVTALVVLTCANFVSMFDRVQISALMQPIKADFNLSDTQLGLLTGTAFSVMYALGALPLAWLSDRTHRVRLLAAALTLWSSMTFLSGMAAGYWHLIAARVGLAFGESAMTPTAHSILADYYPPHRRALPIGIETAGASLGTLLGMSVAGWVAMTIGWREALMIAGVPGLLLALTMLLVLKEPPRTQVKVVDTTKASERWASVVGALLAIKPFRWLILCGILNSAMTNGLGQWVPAFFVRSHGISLAEAGVFVGVALGLGGGLGHVIGGGISNRAAARDPVSPFRISAGFSLAILPFYLTALWVPNTAAAIFCLFMAKTIGGMFVSVVFMGIQGVCNPRYRATAVAFVLLCVVLGSYGAIPTGIGALSDALTPRFGHDSLRVAMSFMMVIPLVMAFAYRRVATTLRQHTLS